MLARDSHAGFLDADGRRLEYRWIAARNRRLPPLVFLHEGLGSVSLWRDVPDALAAATGAGALVYSRAGYGASDPVPLPRPVRYMHDEGLETLPAVLDAAGFERAVLVGHSDGASIAIIHAGGAPDRARVAGLILEAPHVFCEDLSVTSIDQARVAYETTDLRARLQRHHGDNVDVAFWGWNRVWLDPAFRHWNIEEYLPRITAPTLVIQGADDEYGTAAQYEAVARQVAGPCEVRVLPRCGHSPHRDQRDASLEAMRAFVAGLGSINREASCG